MSELSAYELQREANIRANEAQLAALGLAPGGGIVPARAPARPPTKRPKVAKLPPVSERRSSRLDGAKAPDYFIASETAGGAITIGGDKHALQAVKEEVEREATDPLTRFGLEAMPEKEEDLLDGERSAWDALYQVKRAKAAELQIEGYKVCQHRSLCEMVRRVPTSIDELRECWGFGGSGVRVDKYGTLFLDALRPFVDALNDVHAQAREEYVSPDAANYDDDDEEEENAEDAPVAIFSMGSMPTGPQEMLPGEVPAYEALIAATHVRAEAIGERWVWNIAMSRSLCEMVRRVPTSIDELRECWGFGGSGVRVQRHGAFLLAALDPHVAALRVLHASADSESAPLAAEVMSKSKPKRKRGEGDTSNEHGQGGSVEKSSRRQHVRQGDVSDSEQNSSVPRMRRPKIDVLAESHSGRLTRATRASGASWFCSSCTTLNLVEDELCSNAECRLSRKVVGVDTLDGDEKITGKANDAEMSGSAHMAATRRAGSKRRAVASTP